MELVLQGEILRLEPLRTRNGFGTGMHGGTIFIRGEVDPACLGKEVKTGEVTTHDMDLLKTHIGDFCAQFKLDLDEILKKPFTKIHPFSHRPYGTIYAY